MTTGPTYFDSANPVHVTQWEKDLFVDTFKRTVNFNPKFGLVSEKPTAMIQRKKELFREGGTTGRFTIVRQLRQKPTGGTQTLRGREEGLRTSTFDIKIDTVRHGVSIEGRVTQQRVLWDVAKKARMELGQYFPVIMEAGASMHLAGFDIDANADGTRPHEWYLDGTDSALTFHNTVNAPDTKHIRRGGGYATDELVGADPTAYLDLPDVDEMVALAKTLPLPIRPVEIYGGEYYVLQVHPHVVNHWRNGGSEWFRLMLASVQGGMINGNPIFRGTLGAVNGVLYIENPYMPPGIHSTLDTVVTNTRRCVLCGAQSLLFGIGRDFDHENTFLFQKEGWDYNKGKGIAAETMMGIGVPRFSVSEVNETHDYGRIVFTSYAKELQTYTAS